jgi:hypothetical protein
MAEKQRNRVEGLRGLRYGEVLLVSAADGQYRAEVYNTLGLNDCPPALFAELDLEAIAAEHGALVALRNGPRRWVLDAIESRTGREVVKKFGALEAFLAATVELGDAMPTPGAYLERRVARDTVFEWGAGTPLHELRAPDGRTYVMQALSLGVDATQTLDSLAGLADRLAAPEGWSFATRTQGDALRVLSDADGVATVVQDELQNTYQRIDRLDAPR